MAEIKDAYKLLSPLLGAGVASTVFAVALLASGQNSTLTGTPAGQVVIKGFSAHTPASRLTWADHPAAGHHSGGDRNREHGTERYGSAVDSQSSCAQAG